MTLGEFATIEVAKRRGLLEDALLLALHTPRVEEVHRVRTSWRRLEAAHRIVPWCAEEHAWRPIQKRMKHLMRVSAELRDRDNALLFLSGEEHLCQAIRGQRGLWEGEFLEAIRRVLPFEFPAAPTHPGLALRAASAVAAEIVTTSEKLLQQHRKLLRHSSDTRQWHKFRIQAKRHRYTLEFFEPLDPSSYGAAIPQLKEMQDHLGALEDIVAAIRVAKAAAPDSDLIRPTLRRLRGKLRGELNSLQKGIY